MNKSWRSLEIGDVVFYRFVMNDHPYNHYELIKRKFCRSDDRMYFTFSNVPDKTLCGVGIPISDGLDKQVVIVDT